MNPKISILTPVYNAQDFLEECIQSVLQQNANFEMLLVDDGSTDTSPEICDAFAKSDARVRVIHQKNMGPTAARKTGMHAAKGDYLLFLDSDDYLADGLLNYLENVIDSSSPDVIIFYGTEFGRNEETLVSPLLAPGVYQGKNMQIVRESIIFNSKSQLAIPYGVIMKVFRREGYEVYQEMVPDSLYKGEDLAACAPFIAKANRVVVSDYMGYFYRKNPSSIMHTFKGEDINQIKGVATYLKEKMDSFYIGRINEYVLTHYFDYLDQVMQNFGYMEYRQIIKKTLDKALILDLKNTQCQSDRWMDHVAYFLMKHRFWLLLWIARHLKPPKKA